eukprot:PhF_6_TR10603/c0_g1_i1/m.17092
MKCYLILFTVSLMFFFVEPQKLLYNGTWSVQYQSSSRRRRNAMACSQDSLYVLGGQATNGLLTDTIWKLSLASGLWLPLNAPGGFPPKMFFSADYIYPHIYVFGGQTETLMTDNDLWVLDVDSTNGTSRMTWIKIPLIVAPSPRMRHRTIVKDQYLYSFFGIGLDRYQNTVWRLDTRVYEWTRIHPGGKGKNIPSARFDPCCNYVTEYNSVICFGGTMEEDDTNDLWMFWFSNSSWTQLFYSIAGSQYPEKRRGMMCGYRSKTFLMFGGFYSTTATYLPGGLWSLNIADLGKLQWVYTNPSAFADGSLPEPRDLSTSCDQFNGSIVLYGGVDAKGEYHNDLWSLAPLANGSYSFRMLNDDNDRPSRRRGHFTRVLGTTIVIGFGQNEGDLLQDVWQLDVLTDTWTRLSSSSAPYLPRYGSAVSIRGPLLYVFGGATSTTDATALTAELLWFDVSQPSLGWKLMSSVTLTEARFNHGMVNMDRYLAVFGGFVVCGAVTCLSNHVRLFDPLQQAWLAIQTVNPPSARQAFGFIVTTRNRDVYILGGMTTRAALSDRYIMRIKTNGTLITAVFEKLPSLSDVGDPRLGIRGDMASVGQQSHYILCGGAVGTISSVTPRLACLEYDAVSGNNTILPPPPYYGTAQSGAYIGSQVYNLFGGIVQGSMLVPLTDSSTVISMQIPMASFCKANTTNDTNCLICAPGSTNPTCDYAPEGYYQANPLQPPVPCPAGTFNPYRGTHSSTFCQWCPKGFYSPTSGAAKCKVCPEGYACSLGVTQPVPSYGGAVDTSINYTITQPPPFQEGTVPTSVVASYVTLITVVTFVVCLLLCCQQRRRNLRIEHYVSQDLKKVVFDVYAQYAQPIGCNKVQYERVMYDIRMPTSNLRQELIQELFDAFNKAGVNHIGFHDICEIIAVLVERGSIPPSKGTPAAEAGQRSFKKQIFDNIALEAMDTFTDQHRNMSIGSPIVLSRTKLGGALSIWSKTITLVVASLLLVVYWYDNILETRSVLPGELVASDTVKSTFVLIARAVSSSPASNCVLDTSGGGNSCAVGVDHSSFGFSGESYGPATCSYSPGMCTMRVECKRCSVHEKSWAMFLFHPNSFANSVEIEVIILSGVNNIDDDGVHQPPSVVKAQFTAGDGEALKGYDATTLKVLLTPTLFYSPRDSFRARSIEDTGYHIRFDPSSSTGNRVTSSTFGQFYGVPVRIELTTSETTLVVRRDLKQSQLAFVTNVMGAISGLAGMMVAMLSFLEGFQNWMKDRRLRKLRRPDTDLNDIKLDSASTASFEVLPQADEVGVVCNAKDKPMKGMEMEQSPRTPVQTNPIPFQPPRGPIPPPPPKFKPSKMDL